MRYTNVSRMFDSQLLIGTGIAQFTRVWAAVSADTDVAKVSVGFGVRITVRVSACSFGDKNDAYIPCTTYIGAAIT